MSTEKPLKSAAASLDELDDLLKRLHDVEERFEGLNFHEDGDDDANIDDEDEDDDVAAIVASASALGSGAALSRSSLASGSASLADTAGAAHAGFDADAFTDAAADVDADDSDSPGRSLTPSMIAIRVLNAMAAMLPAGPAPSTAAVTSPTPAAAATAALTPANIASDAELRAYLASPQCPTNALTAAVPAAAAAAAFEAALAPRATAAPAAPADTADTLGASTVSGAGTPWDPTALPPRVSARVWGYPRLYLDRLNLRDLSSLDLCGGTTHLYLQHNDLDDGGVDAAAWDHLAGSLVLLSLAANRLASVPPVGGLSRLRALDLRDNRIEWEALMGAEIPDAMEHLWLGGNPCVRRDGYRALVIGSLPMLRTLDGVTVSRAERAAADAAAAAAGVGGSDDDENDNDNDGDKDEDAEEEEEDDDVGLFGAGNGDGDLKNTSADADDDNDSALEKDVLTTLAMRRLLAAGPVYGPPATTSAGAAANAGAVVGAPSAAAGRLGSLTDALLGKSAQRAAAFARGRDERAAQLAEWKGGKLKEIEAAVRARNERAAAEAEAEAEAAAGQED